MSKVKMPRQANPEGSRYAFVIPNDDEGNMFLELCRKYLNDETYKLVKRNRGQRATHSRSDGYGDRGYDQELPSKYAERFVLYIDSKPPSEHKIQAQKIKDNDRLTELLADNYYLRKELHSLHSRLDGIKSLLN